MNQAAGNQVEFWKTVRENGVYPTRETGLDPFTINFTSFSTKQNRSNRYYARKLTNVKFTESIGLHSLTYTETDIYDHIFILDIRDQPPENSVMLCLRINSQLYAIGTEARHDGGSTA